MRSVRTIVACALGCVGGCLVDFPLPAEVETTSSTTVVDPSTTGTAATTATTAPADMGETGRMDVPPAAGEEPWIRVAAIASRFASDRLPDVNEVARFHLLVASVEQTQTWAGDGSDAWTNLRTLAPDMRIFLAVETPANYAPYEEIGDGWDWIVENHGVDAADRWTAVGVENPTSYLRWSTHYAMTLEPQTWRAYWIEAARTSLVEQIGAEALANVDGIYILAQAGYRYPVAGAWEAEVSPGVLEPDDPADYHDGVDYDDAKFRTDFDLLLDEAIEGFGEDGLEVAVGFSGLHETEHWSALDGRAQPVAFAFTSAGLIQQWGATYSVVHYETKLEQAATVHNMGFVHGNQGASAAIPGTGLAKMDATAMTGPGEGATEMTGWEALWFALAGYTATADFDRDDQYFYFSVWGFNEFHWFDEYDPELLHLGTPRDARFDLDGATMREFDDGWVVLNGTQTDLTGVRVPEGSARVITHDNFRAPETAELVDNFDLPLHRGVILLREGANIGRD